MPEPEPFPTDHPTERNMSEGRYNFFKERYTRTSTVLSRYEQNHRRSGKLWRKLTLLKCTLHILLVLGRRMLSLSEKRTIAYHTGAVFGLEETIRRLLTPRE